MFSMFSIEYLTFTAVQVAMEPRVGVQTTANTVVAPARPAGKEGPHLPWTGSMAGPEFPLTYMPFMERMLNVLASSFGEMTALPLADRLAFVENQDKQARMLRLVQILVFFVRSVLGRELRRWLLLELCKGEWLGTCFRALAVEVSPNLQSSYSNIVAYFAEPLDNKKFPPPLRWHQNCSRGFWYMDKSRFAARALKLWCIYLCLWG